MALLKRDHGIEVKSASSTIEEVVGRQFVDRLARQRGITLPSGDVFAEGAAAKAAPKKPALVKKGAAQEPAKPAAPTLGPPRLVKAAKAIHQAERAAAASHDAGDADAVAEHEPTDVHEPHAESKSTTRRSKRCPSPSVTHAPEPEVEVELPVAELPAVAPATAHTESTAAEAAEPAPQAPADSAADRRRPPAVGPHRAAVVAPADRGSQRAGDAAAAGRPSGAAAAAPGPAARAAAPARRASWDRRRRTGTPTVAPPRPGVLPPRPAPPGGPRPSYQTPQTLGGPRPLPSQPVRPQQPGMGARPGMPGRPGMPPPGGARPGQPGGWRPPAPRPSGGRRHTARPEQPRGSMAPTAPPPITKNITLAEGMTVKDLADKLDARVKDVLKKLLEQGRMMTINSTVDSETASSLAREFGADVQMRTFEQEIVDVDTTESSPGRRRAARAGRDRHGPRRPRQDDAARRDSRDARRRTRSRRHHAAHRRLSRHGGRSQHRVPRHAGSRSLHDDAVARRQGHRRGRPGRRRRRRRHAADA